MHSPLEQEIIKAVLNLRYQKLHPKVFGSLRHSSGFDYPGVCHANTYEAERADFMRRSLPIEGFSVLDIGANIGYFTLDAILAGAAKVVSIEGGEADCQLINMQAQLLELSHRIEVSRATFDFEDRHQKKYDMILCLNVLHHVGRYFGAPDICLPKAKDKIIEYLNSLSKITKYCWFQMGYNWKGDESLPLFECGLKGEVIAFLKENISEAWRIREIGILDPDTRNYLANDENLERFDNIGEFGNRPLFLLESRED